jgi:citrate lyase subunit beta/citryl-CoA lyase
MNPTTTQQILSCLYQGGILLFPTAMGFGLAATEESAIRKIYALKNRPLSKPGGIAVTPRLFEQFCGSRHQKVAGLIKRPVGLIDYYNKEHPVLSKASSFLKNNDTIAFFIHLHEQLDTLAEQCFEEGKVLMVTSANKAGGGNVYHRNKLHPDFLEHADFIIDGEADYYYNKRGSFETITNTLLDLTEGSIRRPGLFANEISHWAYKKGLLKDDPTPSQVRSQTPDTALFILAYKQKVYDQLPYFHRPDHLIIDLQDSCPPMYREQARALLQNFMHSGTKVQKSIFIRCNELAEMEELKKDFSLNYSDHITGFWLPMVRSKQDMETYEAMVLEIEKRCRLPIGHFQLVPILERGEAYMNTFEIAGASKRVSALVVGHADLDADIGSTRNDLGLGIARQQAVIAARVYGLLAIDTPYTEIHDYEGLIADTQKASEMGMDAKVVLHPNQVGFVQEVFSISKKEHDILKRDLAFYDQMGGGMLVSESNKLLAPPFVKKIKRDLRKKVKKSNSQVFNVVVPQTMEQGFSVQQLHVGKVIEGRFPTTIDAAWVTQWKSMVNNCYRIENDEPFAQRLGFTSRPIPYQALINFALCELVQPFSIHCKYHLGVGNVRQLQPAYYDDTLSSSMCIVDLFSTSSKKYTVVKSRINLVNQGGEVVLQMDRSSLFDYFETEKEAVPVPVLFEDKDKSDEQRMIEKNIKLLTGPPSNSALTSLSKGSLIAHTISNVVDLTTSSVYCNLFRNTHPVHTNKIRFGADQIAISGGLVMPVVCSIAANDLGQVCQEAVLGTTHLNPVRDGDQLGAMSYVLERKELSEGVYSLKLCTYGIRNIDVSRSLPAHSIPLELFLSDDLRPKEMERLLLNACPVLSKKLAVKVYWTIIVAEG